MLTPYLPFDGIPHAGGAFLGEYMRLVRRRADVLLIAPALDENVDALPAVRAAGNRVLLVGIDKRRRKLPVRALNRARTLAGSMHIEAQLERSFRTSVPWGVLAASDVVELQWSWFLPFVPDVRRAAPAAVISAVMHDVLTQGMVRRGVEASTRRERSYARLMALRCRRREPRLINRTDVAWVFSEKDRQLLHRLGTRVPVRVMDPHLDRPAAPGGPADDPCVLFTGHLKRAPNYEGVLWFLDWVWPQVVARMPDARFIIAGADPPRAVQNRATQSIAITGYVDDLDAFYAKARAFVAPLLSGAGLKFKVPQAMIHGLPVVATTVAAEGIVERSGPNAFASITDDPGVMATALVGLLRDRDLARTIGAQGRRWAENAYDFSASVGRVMQTYASLSTSV